MSVIEYGADPHCLRVEASAKLAAGEPGVNVQARGKAFDVSIREFVQAETVSADAGAIGEEVAAVLQGTFRIDAAGETYVLARGEAIVIPAGEPRLWNCTSERGVLYRVIVREPVIEEVAAAS